MKDVFTVGSLSGKLLRLVCHSLTEIRRTGDKRLFIACSMAFCLLVTSFVRAQDSAGVRRTITGKVLNENGTGIPGATVKWSATAAVLTDEKGEYKAQITDQTKELIISYIGYDAAKVAIGAENRYVTSLAPHVSGLSEVVVTGYSSQNKKDIIGAVTVVSGKDLTATPSPNVVAQLQGRAAGVSVSTAGDPSGNASIRIRGFASYGNNNPLYIIDGIATTDISRINGDDIESMQVLKDASSASIYGARAANGVIVITTKHGKSGVTKLTYDSYVGFQRIPLSRAPKVLDPTGVMEYLKLTKDASYIDPVFGKYGSFAIPDFYIVSNNFKGGVSASDPRANPSLYSIVDYDNAYQIFKPTIEGTNWFEAMTQKAVMQNHQLSASGGTESANFYFSLNYMNQQGTFRYTGYERYSVRLNSSFDVKKYLTIGENLQVAFDNRKGSTALTGEGNPWSDAYRSSSFVPVYDIKGGWGGSKIGGTAGNGYNPLANLYRSKDFSSKSLRASGNVFATVNFTDYLSAKTSFGIDAIRSDDQRQSLKQYENTENNKVTGYNAGSSSRFNWIWTNTLNLNKAFGANHRLQAFIGTEAISNNASSLAASKRRFDFETASFLSLNTALPQSLSDVSASDSRETITINSYFAKADYTFKNRYLFNATFRRDGASVFGPSVRYANFPSAGIGWRLSEEKFLHHVKWISDMKLRGGWGKMGSISNVSAVNQFSTYQSDVSVNNYPITGSSTSSEQGFGAAREGNLLTKWETTESINIGLDLSAFNSWTLTVDVYSKNTNDLLVPSLANGLELNVAKPMTNLGTMNNKGIDLMLGKTGKIGGELTYDASMTFSHYKNELTRLNNESTPQILGIGRIGNASFTGKGYPVSSFYGYTIDGFYNSQSEVDKGPLINGAPARVGTWKYKDLNGDNNITAADAGIIGSPHPDFQMTLNLNVRWKNFDIQGLLFWNKGNDLFNYTKFFTYMGALGGGIAEGKLSDAWTPQTIATAKTPRLGVGGENGYTGFVTSNTSTFYLESGSYLRMKTLQLGYTMPKELMKRIGIDNLRLYVQAQNLFTVTKYTGGDPDLGLISANGTDQTLGFDMAGYPNPRQFLFGVNLNF